MTYDLIQTATQNVKDILQDSINFDSTKNQALVIFDTQNELTKILTTAYKNALPEAIFLDFEAFTKEELIDFFVKLKPLDLVVLIQSGSFRLDDFRIRLQLFNLKLKVIEHLHLYRNEPKSWPIYIDSLAYDKSYYDKMGDFLHQKLASCEKLTLKYSDKNIVYELQVTGGLEAPKLNTGNYYKMENIGGTFPIGEVFTEAKNLENMNGSFWVYAFANSKFEINMSTKFRIDIQDGLIISYCDNAPTEFIEVLEKVKTQERAVIREVGFGLNRAISKDILLGDITAFERIVGVHLSLGEKHSVYKKDGISASKARFHIDLFVLTDQVVVDNEIIFENGKYVV